MSILNQAAYLYVFSKELAGINKKIKSLSKKIHRHAQDHSNTSNDSKKEKYRKKHNKAKEEIAKLVKRHGQVLSRIRHHMVGYNEALRKEHKI